MSPTSGLIYATGRITNPKWTDEQFNQWYNTVHIPQTFSITNGPKAGFRFKNMDPAKAPYQYLALYPIADLHADISDAAEKLKLTDALIPDGDNYLNLCEWDVRHYSKIATIDGSDKTGTRIGNRVVTVSYEPGPGAPDPELWYDPRLLEEIRTKAGYIRMHGFELDETRAASGKDGEERMVPKYLAVLEFQDEEIPPMHIEFNGPSEQRPIYQTAKLVVRDMWEGIYEAGNEKIGL
jgi:hypothetical protein